MNPSGSPVWVPTSAPIALMASSSSRMIARKISRFSPK
jgi:hypothetical protein